MSKMEDANVSSDNHSDSDISESWTIIDTSAEAGDNQNSVISSTTDQNGQISKSNDTPIDEEVDTDGVAVISDDEDASRTPSPTYLPSPPVFTDPETSSIGTLRDSEDELPDDFHLSEKKIKSYVHRRNNKVSNLLNIVLLGTIVTAVTLAVGFMWGINDTCSLDMLTSVNKILTNLQKLQHENDILRNKIKMLQFMRHKPIKSDPDFEHFLQHQMFENNILFDAPPRRINKHNHGNVPMNKGGNPYINAIEIDVLDYDNLEINESDDAYLEAENVSKGTGHKEKRDISPESMNVAEIGQETCSQKMETKPVIKNTYHSSEEVNEPSNPKETKKKSSEKDAKKAEKKAKKSKRQKKRKMQRLAAIDEDFQTSQITNNEKDDWYNKLYDGRQRFRENAMDKYVWQNKAKWYFKRMNHREKYRHNNQNYKMPYGGKQQKEYFKSKQ